MYIEKETRDALFSRLSFASNAGYVRYLDSSNNRIDFLIHFPSMVSKLFRIMFSYQDHLSMLYAKHSHAYRQGELNSVDVQFLRTVYLWKLKIMTVSHNSLQIRHTQWLDTMMRSRWGWKCFCHPKSTARFNIQLKCTCFSPILTNCFGFLT